MNFNYSRAFIARAIMTSSCLRCLFLVIVRSLEVTSSLPAAGGWSHDDVGACSLARGVGRGARRCLYRSDSLPAGGTEQAAKARARVAIPRTAMAHFNADGTPKSILKKTASVSNDALSCE